MEELKDDLEKESKGALCVLNGSKTAYIEEQERKILRLFADMCNAIGTQGLAKRLHIDCTGGAYADRMSGGGPGTETPRAKFLLYSYDVN